MKSRRESSIGSALAAALFPLACAGCGATGSWYCRACTAALRPATPCVPPPAIRAWFAPYAYEDGVRRLVITAKYRRGQQALDWFAAAMHAAVPSGYDGIVTWVPTTPARRAQRGFDHAQRLAEAFARHRGLPVAARLRRLDDTPQTGRLAVARRSAPPRFAARLLNGDSAGRVILVDDVATTGATLGAAAAQLRRAGYAEVIAVTGARADPRRRGAHHS